MTWRNIAFLFMFFALCVMGWLAYQRFPFIAFFTGFGTVSGWPALLAGWPVYALIVVMAMCIGLPLGAWIGESSRKWDAAEQKAVLEEQQRQARDAEQKARETFAAAEQAKRDGEAHLPRIAELTIENAKLGKDLNGAIEGIKDRKETIKKLRKKLKENQDDSLIQKNKSLRATIRENRQRIKTLEERLRDTDKSAS